jgi:hypothetical protein
MPRKAPKEYRCVADYTGNARNRTDCTGMWRIGEYCIILSLVDVIHHIVTIRYIDVIGILVRLEQTATICWHPSYAYTRNE